MTTTKVKGICKGIKLITKIFVAKEREIEIEIGHPTDVKHLAHIGLDEPSGGTPKWMNEFKLGPDFSVPSISQKSQTTNSNHPPTPKSSSHSNVKLDEQNPTESRKDSRKQKRKNNNSTSSPRSLRSAKLKEVKIYEKDQVSSLE